ncbi:8422_t:CDS:2 [Ambispora gerdemannii]|uniref:8422_t:CDS:1 n=1 Tax=Ambispora gerdemannii TaxID=144530 RepID=A0A9N9FKY9_9GLOM|nr:8422_t:CDS:2 [Ambispora gerdemannii]
MEDNTINYIDMRERKRDVHQIINKGLFLNMVLALFSPLVKRPDLCQ